MFLNQILFIKYFDEITFFKFITAHFDNAIVIVILFGGVLSSHP